MRHYNRPQGSMAVPSGTMACSNRVEEIKVVVGDKLIEKAKAKHQDALNSIYEQSDKVYKDYARRIGRPLVGKRPSSLGPINTSTIK